MQLSPIFNFRGAMGYDEGPGRRLLPSPDSKFKIFIEFGHGKLKKR